MSDMNYISPSGAAPNYGRVPDLPFLAGMFQVQRHGDYNDLMALQKQLGLMSSQEKANKLQEWEQNAGVRESRRLADVLTNEAEAGVVGRRKEAETRIPELKVEEAQAVMPGRIAATNFENDEKVLKGKIDQANRAMQHLSQFEAIANAGGPTSIEDFSKAALASGMKPDDPRYKFLMSAGSPQELGSRLGQMREHATKTAAQHQQMLERAQIEGTIKGRLQREHDERQATLLRELTKMKVEGQADIWDKRVGAKTEQVSKTLEQEVNRLENEYNRAIKEAAKTAGSWDANSETAQNLGMLEDRLKQAKEEFRMTKAMKALTDTGVMSSIMEKPELFNKIWGIVTSQIEPTQVRNAPVAPGSAPRAPNTPPAGATIIEYDASGKPVKK